MRNWWSKWVRLSDDRRESLALARNAYEATGGQTVVEHGSDEFGSWVTAAGPERIAWEAFFDAMLERGQDPWKSEKWFNRHLDRPAT